MLLDSRRSEVTKKQYTCCDYCAEIQLVCNHIESQTRESKKTKGEATQKSEKSECELIIILGGNSRIRLGIPKIFVSEEEYVLSHWSLRNRTPCSQPDQWYCRTIEAQVRP